MRFPKVIKISMVQNCVKVSLLIVGYGVLLESFNIAEAKNSKKFFLMISSTGDKQNFCATEF